MTLMTIGWVLVMAYFCLRDIKRINEKRRQILKICRLIDEKKFTEAELQEFNDYIENGWIKNYQDVNLLIDSFKSKFTPVFNASKLLMGGLLGTFFGLFLSFWKLKGISDTQKYISALFNGASLAITSSIAGIVFFFILELLYILLFENNLNNMINSLKKYIIENAAPTEVSLTRLTKNLNTITENIQPLTENLHNAVKDFSSSIIEFKNINNEFIRAGQELKSSINELNNQYIVITDLMERSTIEKDDLLSITSSFSEISKEIKSFVLRYDLYSSKLEGKFNSLSESIEKSFTKFDSIPEILKGAINDILTSTKEDLKSLYAKFANILNEIKSNSDKQLEKYKDIVESFKNGIVEISEENLKNAENMIKQIELTIKDTNKSLIEFFDDFVSKIDSIKISLENKLSYLEKIENIVTLIDETLPQKISNEIQKLGEGRIVNELVYLKTILEDVLENSKKYTSVTSLNPILAKLEEIKVSIENKRFSIFGGR